MTVREGGCLCGAVRYRIEAGQTDERVFMRSGG